MRRRPVSRVLCSSRLCTANGGDHSSGTTVTRRLKRPTRKHRTGRSQSLPYLVLHRTGFTEPIRLPGPLVSSYLTVSPLPVLPKKPSAVCSLLHFPWDFSPRELPGVLPCGARTFLQSREISGRPAGSAFQIIAGFSTFRDSLPACG